MTEIFSTTEQATEFTVTIVTGRGRSTRTATSAITAEVMKRYAREAGISQFSVQNEDGEELGASDFPYEGDIVIKEYNAAKA